jgi:hypothetical protein
VPELERELRELTVEWPATPDLAAAVAVRIGTGAAAEPRRRAPRRRTRPRALAYAAGLLLALVGGTLAIPPARSAVLEVLGLKGARIERRAPTATPTPTPAPGATPAGELGNGLQLGTRVRDADVAGRVGFDAAPPPALGRPDAVYVAARPPGGAVSYVYRPRPGFPRVEETGVGLIVTEFVATVTPVIQKAAGPGTTVEPVRVGDERGYWLAGTPHGFAFVDRDGQATFEDERLAGPTLLLEHDGLLLRLEGDMTKERALALARSIPARR